MRWLFFLPVLAFAQINQNGDFQVWARSFNEVELNDTFGVQVWGEMRWGDNGSKLYFNYLQGQMVYRPAWWMFVAPGYRQVVRRLPTNSNHWAFQYVLLVDVAFVVWKYNGWEVRDRNRVEYIIVQTENNPWQYRNRLRLLAPELGGWCIPYVENEIFWRQTRGINQDRVSGGMIVQFSEHVGSEVSYILRFQKRAEDWVHQNVLNLMLVTWF